MDTKANSNTLEKKRITAVSIPVTDLGGDDLESILRQKALENFRKFQGGLLPSSNASLKIDNESDVNKISSARTNIIQNKSTKQDSSDGACLIRETNYSCMPALKRNLSHHKEIKKDTKGHEDVGKVPITNNRMPFIHLMRWHCPFLQKMRIALLLMRSLVNLHQALILIWEQELLMHVVLLPRNQLASNQLQVSMS